MSLINTWLYNLFSFVPGWIKSIIIFVDFIVPFQFFFLLYRSKLQFLTIIGHRFIINAALSHWLTHNLWVIIYDSWFMTCLKSIEQFLWSKKWPREYSDQWRKTQSTTKNDHWVLEQKWVQIRWGASSRWSVGPNNPGPVKRRVNKPA